MLSKWKGDDFVRISLLRESRDISPSTLDIH